MKQYGDGVTYVRNAVPINAIVLRASNDESLTLLFANLDGAAFVGQGSMNGIAKIEHNIRPLMQGSKFGWLENADRAGYESFVAHVAGQSAAEALDEAQGEVPAGDPDSPHAIVGGGPVDSAIVAVNVFANKPAEQSGFIIHGDGTPIIPGEPAPIQPTGPGPEPEPEPAAEPSTGPPPAQQEAAEEAPKSE